MSNTVVINSTPSPNLPVSRPLTLLMAVTVGMLVANLHYLPPLLGVVAGDLKLGEGQVGTAATLAVTAQALAMLLILPLGDIYDRRKLILTSVAASVVALAGVAMAGNLSFLMGAMFVLGLVTTGTHMTVSLAAGLAPPAQRGRVVGTVISGLLTGILAARIFGGVVGGHLGWRAVYLSAAAAQTLLLAVLWRSLPATRPATDLSYGRLLRSMWTLWRSEPVLREACLFGAMTFGAFSAFWMTLAFHMATPPLHYGSQAVGLMGLFALAGALTAAGAGRLADRYGARPISGAFLLVTAGSFVVLWLCRHSFWGMGLGVVLMDLGIQGVHVSNQARVYALNPAARNRLGAIYIVTYFVGGSLGSALGLWAWGRSGWLGVCAVGGGMALAAAASFLLARREAPEPSCSPAADPA